MAGMKGRSGGARSKAGRLQTRLLLGKEAAQELAIIVAHKRGINPSIRAEDIVSQWIHRHWQELDAQFQENAS
jgi:hypothetical protein